MDDLQAPLRDDLGLRTTDVPLARTDVPLARTVVPQHTCTKCAGSETPSSEGNRVYALGRIEPRFPQLAIEKELAQVLGREAPVGIPDRQALRESLRRRENRYLLRQMCWVFLVGGTPTYLLRPRDSADYELLVDAMRETPRPTDIDLTIGYRGGFAPPEMCNGLQLPIVTFEQLYSFDLDGLVKAIPAPKGTSDKVFRPTAEDLFLRVLQIADNAGATEDHRALNYIAVRYDRIYALAAEQLAKNAHLTSVHVRPSTLSSTRTLRDVIFAFANRTTDVVEKFSVRVDVTEMFPFLVSKLAPYYDRT